MMCRAKASFVFLILLAFASQPVLGRTSRTSARLEGMTYVKARQVVLSFGWHPLIGGCSGGGTDEQTCARYPEIGNCSGTGIGFCDMTFFRRDRCLILVTVGGSNMGDATVRDVQFRRGPCSKDPNEFR